VERSGARDSNQPPLDNVFDEDDGVSYFSSNTQKKFKNVRDTQDDQQSEEEEADEVDLVVYPRKREKRFKFSKSKQEAFIV